MDLKFSPAQVSCNTRSGRLAEKDEISLPHEISPNDRLMPLSAARRCFPGKPAVSTLWRWSTQGLNGVVLKTVRSGKRIFVSHDAIEEFLSACNAGR